MPIAFSSQQLTHEGVRAGYRRCGQAGPQLVLLHGISSGAVSWQACAHELGRYARVLAWDAPGYGVSTPLPQMQPKATHYAQRLGSLLDAQGIDACVLVGHSLGCLMAAAFAQAYPQRVQALVLFSPALGYGNRPDAQQMRQRRWDDLQQGLPALIESLPARLLSQGATDAQREHLRLAAQGMHESGYRQAVELLCGDHLSAYADFPATTHVLCGQDDVVTTPQQSREFAQRYHLPFTLIPGAGHACHIQQPQRVAAGILNVLASRSAGRTAGGSL